MNIPAEAFSRADRVALQQMIDEPDSVEYHGADLAWQAGLASALKGPSLRDSLNFGPPLSQDVDGSGPASR